VFHTWEFTPKAVEKFRSANPDGLVFRDVVINREKEYWSGTSIDVEDRYADFFLSPSSFSTRCLVAWGIDAKKVIEIPFGVDSARFRPAFSVPAQPFRFAFSGGVSRRKGVDTLLRAWEALALPDAELHLYGRVREDVKGQLAAARSVVCHGHVYLPAELPMNHVFVFPSTLEGSAKSVYEALACALPVITTEESGSVVRDGVDGFIVPSCDVDALVDKMRRLYDDTALRARMAASARARAMEFTWDRYARAVVSAYSACILMKRGRIT
jgi:glycosyltransferase involved in cell wall biosynthesis